MITRSLTDTANVILALPEMGSVPAGGASLNAADLQEIFRANTYHEVAGFPTARVKPS